MSRDRAHILRSARVALIAAAMSVLAATASAQTVLDPNFVEFDPSSAHFEIGGDGTPRLSSYSLTVYQAGTTTPLQTIDLGKPAPDPDGKIRVAFISLLSPAPVPGVVYEARVTAVGPDGSSTSDVSNTFSFSTTCSPSITPSSQTFTSAADSGTVSLRTGTGCPWTAVSSAGWLTITSGASGTESGTVAFSVAQNSSAAGRTGTLTIAGQIFTVTQAAAPCTYAISPHSLSIVAAGGTSSFTVTSPGGCAWTATSSVGWITVTAGATGSGNGTVAFSVAANSATTSRTGTITAGGQTFTVTQAAAAPCTYVATPASQSVTAAGGTASATITTGAGCAWSAYSTAAWITLTGATSGSGSGTVTFGVASNTGTTSRTGTIMIAGQIISVTQPGSTSCSYMISPASLSVPAAGGSGSFSMTAGSGCAWTTSSSVGWITVTAGATGSGSGTVAFSVGANPTTSPRTGTITAGGQTFTVNQDAAASSCTYSISPTTQSIGSAGGSGSVAVTATAGCNWTAASSASWITVVAGASGSGNGTVTYNVAANTGAARTGTITIAGQTITITQAAAACSYSVSPTTVTVGASASGGTITVTTGAGCTWGSFSSTPWVTISGAGPGSGSVTYNVAANTTGALRTGTILVAGVTVKFTQGQ